MSAAAVMLLAWALELGFGWPDWLFQRIGHPVVWFGSAVSGLDAALNRDALAHRLRYVLGVLSTLCLVAGATALGIGLVALLPATWWGFVLQSLIASSLIASRSLHAHVADVAEPLAEQDIDQARHAVSMIVGRDPAQLDEDGIARAGLESLAENASDGVVAPLFWGAVAGLPGLFAYKAINTLDSMIGHRNTRYAAYGGFAARLDDAANWIPARLTGLMIAAASGTLGAFQIMFRDARRHRSPNAGWPEAAMAGALDIRLSGPREYAGQVTSDPWLNGAARDPDWDDVLAGLALYRRALAIGAGLLIISTAATAL